jgi:DUF2934 family protein
MFIHQQIQSFLNLGVCKEYPIMAKPRFPKKTTEVKETTTNNNPQSDASARPGNGSSAAAVAETQTAETTPETRKTTRRPEIVRNDARANLVPINVEEEVRRLAYLLSERRGFEPGHEAEDWLTAEREVRQRYRQQSA